jgi:shikimate dehydrogenase
MNITGHTKAFAVLGHPIGHTLSPLMHNTAFRELGMEAVYLAFDVRPDDLADVLRAMHKLGFGGVNLTVPLKEVALRCVDQLDDSARALGAINTVRFTPDGLTGFNTDGQGFLRAFREAFGVAPAQRSVFIIGTGGAGRAVALTLAGEGVLSIALADADRARAEKLAVELETQYFIQDVSVAAAPAEIAAACRRADIVVQATPVGMKPTDPSPLPAEAFRAGQMAFDLVYMYPETAFMKAARQAGARAANGLGMLLHQGACAFELWTGRTPPVESMRKQLEAAVYGPQKGASA